MRVVSMCDGRCERLEMIERDLAGARDRFLCDTLKRAREARQKADAERALDAPAGWPEALAARQTELLAELREYSSEERAAGLAVAVEDDLRACRLAARRVRDFYDAGGVALARTLADIAQQVETALPGSSVAGWLRSGRV